jgi:hypothetical protein
VPGDLGCLVAAGSAEPVREAVDIEPGHGRLQDQLGGVVWVAR